MQKHLSKIFPAVLLLAGGLIIAANFAPQTMNTSKSSTFCCAECEKKGCCGECKKGECSGECVHE